jgi:hypothetical protein
VSDGSGGVFVVWTDYRNGGPPVGGDIYVQRVSGDGDLAAGWPADGLAVSTADSTQGDPHITADGSGGVIVSWRDGRSDALGIHVQRVSAGGALAGWPDAPVVLDNGDLSQSALCGDGAGGVLLAWVGQGEDGFDPYSGLYMSHAAIYMQHVTAAGAVDPAWPKGGELIYSNIALAPSPSPPATAVRSLVMVADGSGGALIVANTLGNGLYVAGGTRIIAFHVQLAPPHLFASSVLWSALPSDYNEVHSPDLTADGAGGAYVAWSRTPDYGFYPGHWTATHVRGDHVAVAGWPVGRPVFNGDAAPTVASIGPDGVLVAWIDDYGGTLFADRLTAEGLTAPGWHDLNHVSTAPYNQHVGVAPDGTGGAFLCWQAGSNVLASHVVGTDGSRSPGWLPEGTRICFATGDESSPQILSGRTGEALVVWQDRRNGNTDLFAQRLADDFPTATEVSLASASASPDGAVLTWFAPGASIEATVYRRTPVTEWRPLTVLMPEGTGSLRFEDRDVVPGGRYAYRLGYRFGGAEAFTRETWLDIPARLALALEGFSPNPAEREVWVSLTLPTSESASIRLLDVTGREVLRREVGSLGAGRQHFRLSVAGELRPGVYWISLLQGVHTLSVRGVVMP